MFKLQFASMFISNKFTIMVWLFGVCFLFFLVGSLKNAPSFEGR